MDRLIADVAYAARRLVRAPSFTAIALLTLALGIGVNTAIFSLIRAVVLRPLPYAESERLVMIWGSRERGETTWLSVPELLGYRGDIDVFDDVAAYAATAANLTGGDQPERVVAAAVTPNLFGVLGASSYAGRAFHPSADAAVIDDQVVLGHGLWQRRFGSRTDVVGQSIQVNGRARTVIGVMPAGFKLPLDFGDTRATELWIPLDLAPQAGSWGDHSFIGIARLRPGVEPAQADAAMRGLEERWVREGHWSNRSLSGRRAVPLQDLVLGDVRHALLLLFGAVGVILLIACANVANLLLARADERHREMSVRTALGASRGRLMGQLLTESVMLSLLGALLAVAVAYAGIRGLVALAPQGIPRVEELRLDGVVLAFTLLLAVATGIIFGVAPALQLSRDDVARAVRESGRAQTGGRGRQRIRDVLAVTQIALSVVLLIGAALLMRSLMELRRIDLGFRASNALTVRTALPEATYPDDASVIRFYRTLRRELAALPGVEAVGGTRLLPLSGTIGDWSITLEGRPRVPEENPNGDWQVVTPGYFETMGMTLVRGRSLLETDEENAPIVAVINETMAARYWPNENPIGRRFHLGTSGRPWITVVGVVAAVKHNAITEGARAEMYVPHAQWSAAGASARRAMTFVLRTRNDPLALLGYVRQAVRSLDPNLPLSDVRTLEGVASDALSRPRFTTLLLTLFAAVALSLATIGIYGVISLLVARRRQEIGIRLALGARPTTILGMVMTRALVLAATGVAFGLTAAALLGRVIASLLYGVTPFDIATFAVVPLLLAAVALLAALVPATRAAAVDPALTLRAE